MESSTERGKVKFSYSSVSSFVVAVIVSSLAIIIIHGPQECQTLFQTFSVPQSQRGWNFHAFLCTNLLLKGPIIFHFVSGMTITRLFLTKIIAMDSVHTKHISPRLSHILSIQYAVYIDMPVSRMSISPIHFFVLFL